MKTERRVKLGKVLIFVVLFAVFLSVGCASAATYTVCTSGCNYTNIQAAIGAADPGNTVEVHSGTYYENVLVNKQLILKGVDTGGGEPVVDAGGSDDVITLIADGITLEGFTATNSSSSGGDAGVKVTSNNNIITGNNASSNRASGIHLYHSSNNILTSNIACNNDACGLRFYSYSSNNNITGNNVCNNNDYGISLIYSSNNKIYLNNWKGSIHRSPFHLTNKGSILRSVF